MVYPNKIIIETIKKEEGCISHMYLDTRGYVTVGVGHLVADVNAACQLPFVQRDTGLPASTEDIIQEFQAIQSQPAGRVAASYYSSTRLDLSEAAIDQILNEQIVEFECTLQQHFNDYQHYPEQAKLALLDMAFNLGANGLLKKFPKLVSSVVNNDWESCAQECRRGGIGESRNAMTRSLFLEAAKSQTA